MGTPSIDHQSPTEYVIEEVDDDDENMAGSTHEHDGLHPVHGHGGTLVRVRL